MVAAEGIYTEELAMGFLFVAGLVVALFVWVVARGGTGLTILLFAVITGSVLFKIAGGGWGWFWPKRGRPKTIPIAGYQSLNAVGAVEVVGESFYQDALSRIAGGKTEGGRP